MHIIRFEDGEGRIRYGEPHGDGRARVLAGEVPWALTPTEEEVRVARLLAPLEPVNIFGIGLNYRDHAEETGMAAPENPVIFMKPTTTVIGPGEPIVIPAACEHGPEVDYEVELAVVIGRRVRDVPVERALDCVFGYTVANDVSARRWQKHGGAGQWVRGKSFDTFCPLGPVLVTADEIGDPQWLGLRTILNGTLLQDGNTSDMIFGVRELIAFLSRDTTLLPGTVILTGTPAGVGFTRSPPVFLSAGDEVTVEVDRIGALTNPVVVAGQD